MSNRLPPGTTKRAAPIGRHPSAPEADFEGSSAPLIGDWARYILNAALRHWVLVVTVFLLGMAATTTYYATATPLYRVETKILAQRQQSLPSIARTAHPDEAPTRTAYEVVHRRENLVSLLKQTNLIPPPGTEPRGGRFRRWLGSITSPSSGPADPEDEALNHLVLRLDKELVVTTGDGTLTISLDWPDPQDAYHLVEAALQNFLEVRQIYEITAIDDAIRLLQERLAAARTNLDKVTAEAQQASTRDVTDPAPGGLAPPVPASASAELQMLAGTLEAKDRAVRDMEDLRRRRMVDLQSQLQEKRGVYSDSHPSVAALQREIESMGRESPQVTALQEEARQAREAYTARLAQESRARPGQARQGAARTFRVPNGSGAEDQRVRDARLQYEQMVARVNAAQSDLDAARAAFKYRYTVTWPARVPRHPVSPNPVRVFGLGTLASLLLALGIAVRPHLAAGRIRERWQVERMLGLPVVAELTRK